MKRGRDLLQRAFSFSDAHAVSNGISSLLTVRLCRLQACKNDVDIMPKVPTLCPCSSLSVSTQVTAFWHSCLFASRRVLGNMKDSREVVSHTVGRLDLCWIWSLVSQGSQSR